MTEETDDKNKITGHNSKEFLCYAIAAAACAIALLYIPLNIRSISTLITLWIPATILVAVLKIVHSGHYSDPPGISGNLFTCKNFAQAILVAFAFAMIATAISVGIKVFAAQHISPHNGACTTGADIGDHFRMRELLFATLLYIIDFLFGCYLIASAYVIKQPRVRWIMLGVIVFLLSVWILQFSDIAAFVLSAPVHGRHDCNRFPLENI